MRGQRARRVGEGATALVGVLLAFAGSEALNLLGLAVVALAASFPLRRLLRRRRTTIEVRYRAQLAELRRGAGAPDPASHSPAWSEVDHLLRARAPRRFVRRVVQDTWDVDAGRAEEMIRGRRRRLEGARGAAPAPSSRSRRGEATAVVGAGPARP